MAPTTVRINAGKHGHRCPEKEKMPRPKPQNPLRVRSIRLTDRDWEELQRRGVAWLRKELVPTGQARMQRTKAIVAQVMAGADARVVAARYHLALSTVRNFVSEARAEAKKKASNESQ